MIYVDINLVYNITQTLVIYETTHKRTESCGTGVQS